MSPLQSILATYRAHSRTEREKGTYFTKKKDLATGKSVNGKPAIEWVMERQAVTTDKDSGITNDAILWATETMHNPKYPLELLLRVVTVSLETKRIVERLPGLEIQERSAK
jgi:predicted helicase